MNSRLVKVGRYVFLLIALFGALNVFVTLQRTAVYLSGDKQIATNVKSERTGSSGRWALNDIYTNTFTSKSSESKGEATSLIKPLKDEVSVVFKDGKAYPEPITGGISAKLPVGLSQFIIFSWLFKETKRKKPASNSTVPYK